MKKLQLYLLSVPFLILTLSGCARIATVKPASYVSDIAPELVREEKAEDPEIYEGRFVKKRYIYLMAWNGIPVGRIIAEFGDVTEYRGRKVYDVRLVTESNKFLSKIYRVEDKYHSYVDVETITSRWYEADRHEGNYRKHVVVEYDFEKMEAIYTNKTDGSVKRCEIFPGVQDPLSTVCYFMTLPVKLGEKVTIKVNLNEKNYEVIGDIEKLEAIRLPGIGVFPAFKIKPTAVHNGKQYKKGRGYLYFSAYKDRNPLYGAVQIPFGKVTATLRSIEET